MIRFVCNVERLIENQCLSGWFNYAVSRTIYDRLLVIADINQLIMEVTMIYLQL